MSNSQHHPTEDLPHRVEAPFLHRNLEERTGMSADDLSFTVTNGLNFRVALGSYRIFYTGDSEDYYQRHRPTQEETDLQTMEDKYLDAAGKRLEEWINKPAAEAEAEAAADEAAIAAEEAAADAAEVPATEDPAPVAVAAAE